MFQLSASAESPARSAIAWISRILVAAGSGLMFVDYKLPGLLLIILAAVLDLGLKLLTKKIVGLPSRTH
jgi:hypothetical protein